MPFEPSRSISFRWKPFSDAEGRSRSSTPVPFRSDALRSRLTCLPGPPSLGAGFTGRAGIRTFVYFDSGSVSSSFFGVVRGYSLIGRGCSSVDRDYSPIGRAGPSHQSGNSSSAKPVRRSSSYGFELLFAYPISNDAVRTHYRIQKIRIS
jgi:hypothetical protein